MQPLPQLPRHYRLILLLHLEQQHQLRCPAAALALALEPCRAAHQGTASLSRAPGAPTSAFAATMTMTQEEEQWRASQTVDDIPSSRN